MGDEIFIGQEEPKKSSKKKILFIVISIILIIILAREAHKFYVFNKSITVMDNIYDNLIHNVNSAYTFQLTGKYYNKSEVNDSISEYYKNKVLYNYMVDSILNGRKDFVTYESAYNLTCKDGTTYNNVGYSDDIKCPDSLNDFGIRVNSGIKTVSPEKAMPLANLGANSVLNLLVEQIIYAKSQAQDIRKGYPDMSKIKANVLFTLTTTWLDATMGISNMKIYKNQNSSETKYASLEELKNIENFAKNFKTYSKEEINSLNFKKDCMESFSSYSNQLTDQTFSSIISSILFISGSSNSICGDLEKMQKDNLIKIIDIINAEKNPFLLLNYKVYSDVMIKCSDNIYTSLGNEQGESDCVSEYFKSYEEELTRNGFIKD